MGYIWYIKFYGNTDYYSSILKIRHDMKKIQLY